jgi:hypothetical protein
MELMDEKTRYEEGVIPHDLVLPSHLLEYLAEISLLAP